jgi:hypothetical protein
MVFCFFSESLWLSKCAKLANLIRNPPQGVWRLEVSIVPLLLAVVAGNKEEQRATHENSLPFPPCSCPSLNEAIQEKTSQSVLFLGSRVDAVLALLTSLAGGHIRNHVRLSGGHCRS